MAKIQPALTRLYFKIVGGADTTEDFYCDISAAISSANRRFYRQGLNWAVAGFSITNVDGTTSPKVQITTLPTVWPMFNAWEKARQLKWDQDRQVLADEGSIKPKFYDFKIFGDTQHMIDFIDNGFQLPEYVDPVDPALNTPSLCAAGQTMIPLAVNPVLPGDASAVLIGDWDYSQITIPNDGAPGVTKEYYLHMLGGNNSGDGDLDGSKALLQGYANSRATPQSPDPATGALTSPGWMTQLFDDGDNLEEIKDVLLQDQTELPYDQDLYPGEVGNFNGWNLVDVIEFQGTNTAVSSKVGMMGCQAPCGILKFTVDDLPSTKEMVIQMDLVAGPHRGYLAAPMQEF